MVLTVDVMGPAPWGFRITGGRDFHTPIMVTKVTERGKAEAADLRPGDIILAINGENAQGMLHAEAQSKIRQSPSPLRLQLDRSRAPGLQACGRVGRGVSLCLAGRVATGRAGWHQPPGCPGLTGSQVCGPRGVGMKWVGEGKVCLRLGLWGLCLQEVVTFVQVGLGGGRGGVWWFTPPLMALPPLLLKASLVKAGFRLVGFAACSPGLGKGGDRWFPKVGHRGESPERNPGRFPQPGEPFGRALNLSQVLPLCPAMLSLGPDPVPSPGPPAPQAVETGSHNALGSPSPSSDSSLLLWPKSVAGVGPKEEEGEEYLLASGKGTKIYKRLRSGAGGGSGSC
ncbi:PDZ and LIM domain protein 2 isoform X2 [Pipistrellus kuhlii]|uniref:PDZ and LIM domain protein 2 isoform X2 n=1 Tax=Pipistrellus kuhlii TaxID=59472 RepID=UPI001E272923|nr:PDZ and LIM domain protein 2 isoform X2 [Pipistrellus kuhlii]